MEYQLGDYCFPPAEYLPPRLFEAITEVRVENPELVVAESARRRGNFHAREDEPCAVK